MGHFQLVCQLIDMPLQLPDLLHSIILSALEVSHCMLQSTHVSLHAVHSVVEGLVLFCHLLHVVLQPLAVQAHVSVVLEDVILL
jgi:hypothetical protein